MEKGPDPLTVTTRGDHCQSSPSFVKEEIQPKQRFEGNFSLLDHSSQTRGGFGARLWKSVHNKQPKRKNDTS